MTHTPMRCSSKNDRLIGCSLNEALTIPAALKESVLIMSVVSLFKAAKRDWSNQELAEFYRVEAALLRAGLPIDADRGRTDEGDPWFIFINRETDDIVIHFARIDGLYIVVSSLGDGVARGHDFRKLIEGILDSSPILLPRTDNPNKSKVHIHPAALLVALVFACFLKSTKADAHDGGVPSTETPGKTDASGSGFILQDYRHANLFVAAVAFAVMYEHDRPFEGTDGLRSAETVITEHYVAHSAREGYVVDDVSDGTESASSRTSLTTQQSISETSSFRDEHAGTAPAEGEASGAEKQIIGGASEYASVALDVIRADAAPSPVVADDLIITDNTIHHPVGVADYVKEGEKNLALKYIEALLGIKSENIPSASIDYFHYLGEVVSQIVTLPEGVSSPAVLVADAQLEARAEVFNPYKMINWFVANNPDFVVQRLNNGFMLLDPDVTFDEPGVDVMELAFSDGSMIILVGLAGLPEAALV